MQNEKIFPKIKIGLESIDKILGGGLSKGELSVILAPPSVGKSAYIEERMKEIAENWETRKTWTTKYELIGNTVFPVTYFSDGLVIIDYPEKPFSEQVKTKKMKVSAQVVLLNESGYVLGVSRKTNHSDFGLAGGKMEDIDNDNPMAAAIRETKEETGLDITNLRLIFAIHKDGYMGYTYLADYSGEINHNEPHVVQWVSFGTLIAGSFGKYNQLVSESLDDMGINYRK